MKYYIVCFLLIFSFKLSFSQTFENGYYVTLQNDTMSTKIKVPKDLFGSVQIEVLERKIKVSDSLSQVVKTLRLTDIKGYGFSYKDRKFDFASKQLKENKSKFFERLADGKNASCYYYYQSGYRGAKNETFIIENLNRSKLVLKNSMSKRKIKKELIKFFPNREDIHQLIDTKSISKRHLDKSLKETIDSINYL